MKTNATKHLKNLVAVFALSCAFVPAMAAMQTVTLAVPGMTCVTSGTRSRTLRSMPICSVMWLLGHPWQAP